jgi:translation elongation factor P/translation initiation factor 5A
MVLVGDDNRHHLVLDTWDVGPMPGRSWRPYRFPCRALDNGQPTTVTVSLSRTAEVLELETRVFEFIHRQHDELLLLDPESGEVVELPAIVSDNLPTLPPNSLVNAAMYSGRPVWILGLSSPTGE